MKIIMVNLLCYGYVMLVMNQIAAKTEWIVLHN